MSSTPYTIWHATASGDHLVRNGITMNHGDVVHYWVSDLPEEKIRKMYNEVKIEDFAAAVFPVNRVNSAEDQNARAKVFCNYMNKLKEAEERARAGVEMGFLK